MPNLIVFYTLVVFKDPENREALVSWTLFGTVVYDEMASWDEIKPVATHNHISQFRESLPNVPQEDIVYATTNKLDKLVFDKYIKHIAALN